MDVIDKGGFGCVIHPPLNCKHAAPTPKHMVSKLQTAKHADYEMQQIQRIKKLCNKKIPNCPDFVTTDVQICDPVLPKKRNAKNTCPLLEKGLDTSFHLTKHGTLRSQKHKTKKAQLKIINQPFLGLNLQRYLLQKANFQNPRTFAEINYSIIQLYQHFVHPLNQNKFYHNDIKTLNIMVDPHGTYRLIDWGLSNSIVFSLSYVSNRPYNSLLLTNYFLEKIQAMKRQGPLHPSAVKQLILHYLDLLNITRDTHYIYTKEILEFLFPDRIGNKDEINPVFLDCLVHFAMKFKTKHKAVETYIHNLDISGIAFLYPDILCAMSIQKHLPLDLFRGVVAFFTKYILHAYDKIDPNDFIRDLNNLNLLVV